MTEKYSHLKTNELQELLKSYQLPTTGQREDLVKKLVDYDEMKAIELELDVELTKITDNQALKESVISDDEDVDLILNASLTAPSPQVEKSAPSFHFTPITFGTSKPPVNTKPKAQDLLKTDAERRLERSKRFGVQLSDVEKRKLRATRFGLPETKSTDNNNKGHVIKKKSRQDVVQKSIVKKEENTQQRRQQQAVIQQPKQVQQNTSQRFRSKQTQHHKSISKQHKQPLVTQQKITKRQLKQQAKTFQKGGRQISIST